MPASPAAFAGVTFLVQVTIPGHPVWRVDESKVSLALLEASAKIFQRNREEAVQLRGHGFNPSPGHR